MVRNDGGSNNGAEVLPTVLTSARAFRPSLGSGGVDGLLRILELPLLTDDDGGGDLGRDKAALALEFVGVGVGVDLSE